LHTVHWRSSDSVAELGIKTHMEMHDSADAVLIVADVRGTCQFNIKCNAATLVTASNPQKPPSVLLC